MKFLIDMPLSPLLAEWLRKRNHDAVHASAVGMARASDREILETARMEGRKIITADLDFSRLITLSEETEPGLILLRGGNYSEKDARTLVSRVLGLVPEEDMNNAVIVVDNQRIRRLSLPLRPGR